VVTADVLGGIAGVVILEVVVVIPVVDVVLGKAAMYKR